jgi:hypothetical protein
MEPLNTESDRFHAIQLAAYYLWQERGSPFGSPETDWFNAEQQLPAEAEDASGKPALVAVAQAMGAALGSVAGMVASAGTLIHSNDEPGTE